MGQSLDILLSDLTLGLRSWFSLSVPTLSVHSAVSAFLCRSPITVLLGLLTTRSVPRTEGCLDPNTEQYPISLPMELP